MYIVFRSSKVNINWPKKAEIIGAVSDESEINVYTRIALLKL